MIAEHLEAQKRIISMMFPAHKEYHGNVCFGVKTAEGFKSMGFADINQIQEKLEKFKFHNNMDYYLTANTTRTGVRTTDNIFSYNNIVIDIDCHSNKLSRYELESLIDELLYRIERDLYNTGEVPQHNICIKTGRGVQLWWCMEQVSADLGWLFHGALDSLMKHIENVVNEYEELSYFSIDKGSSKKDVGFYRFPFTINTKTGTVVDGNIVYDKRYNINDFYNAIKLEEVKIISNFKNKKWENLLEQRINVIEKYTEIKSKQGISEGYRDNYAWLYYNSCYQLYGEEKANEMLDDLNATFIVPLKCNEIKAIKKYIKSKNGLRMKNKTFYEYLGEEPVIINREIEREAKRKEKAKRNKKIKELYEAGMVVKDICKEMNLSKPTVLKVLCIKEIKKERDKKIRALREQGKTIKEIAEKFKLSLRTIQRTAKKQIVEQVKEVYEQLQMTDCLLDHDIIIHKNKSKGEYQILFDTEKLLL